MTASKLSPTKFLGYLTFVEFAAHGVVGGYLLVDAHSRPVEFHCSAPLRPSRAQEILYGPTLRPFLYCEQIGQTLVRESQHSAELILTDSGLALGLRTYVEVPMAWLLPTAAPDDPPLGTGTQSRAFAVGSHQLASLAGFDQDQSLVAARLRDLSSAWEIAEPLDRIREAIQEAHQAAA